MSSTTFTWPDGVTYWVSERGFVGHPQELPFQSKNLPARGLLTFLSGYYTKEREEENNRGQFSPLISSAPHGYWSGQIVSFFGDVLPVQKITKTIKSKLPGMQGWKNEPDEDALQDLLSSGFNYAVGSGWDKITGGFSELPPSEFAATLPPDGLGYFIPAPAAVVLPGAAASLAAARMIPSALSISPSVLLAAQAVITPAFVAAGALIVGGVALSLIETIDDQPSTPELLKQLLEVFWAPMDFPIEEPGADPEIETPPQVDLSDYDQFMSKMSDTSTPKFPLVRIMTDSILDEFKKIGELALKNSGNPDLESINIYFPEPMKEDFDSFIHKKASSFIKNPSPKKVQQNSDQGVKDSKEQGIKDWETQQDLLDKLKEGITLVPEVIPTGVDKTITDLIKEPIPKKPDPLTLPPYLDPEYVPEPDNPDDPPAEGEEYANLGEMIADIPVAIRESSASMSSVMRGKPPLIGGSGIIGLIPAIVQIGDILDRHFNPTEPSDKDCDCITKQDLFDTFDRYFLSAPLNDEDLPVITPKLMADGTSSPKAQFKNIAELLQEFILIKSIGEGYNDHPEGENRVH